MRLGPCFVPNHDTVGTSHCSSPCLSLRFLLQWEGGWGESRHSLNPLFWSHVTRFGGDWLALLITELSPDCFLRTPILLPPTLAMSYLIGHIWHSPCTSHHLYLFCFCISYPMSINGSAIFPGSSLNYTSSMKTSLNLTPVLPILPKPEFMFISFCGQGAGFVYLPWYLTLGPNVLRSQQPGRWSSMVCGLLSGLVLQDLCLSPKPLSLFQEFPMVMVMGN